MSQAKDSRLWLTDSQDQGLWEVGAGSGLGWGGVWGSSSRSAPSLPWENPTGGGATAPGAIVWPRGSRVCVWEDGCLHYHVNPGKARDWSWVGVGPGRGLGWPWPDHTAARKGIPTNPERVFLKLQVMGILLLVPYF